MSSGIRRSKMRRFVVWTGNALQASCLQDSGSEHFKAIATSSPLCAFNLAVQTFSIASCVGVAKVVENGISIFFDGEGKGDKRIKDFWGDLVKPCEISMQGFFVGCGIIDGIEIFLEVISNLKAGKILQPGLQDHGFTLVQVVRSSQQQEPVMHQGSALLIGESCSYVFTNLLQAARKQFQDVELIDDQVSIRQHLMDSIVVGGVHVGTDHMNLFLCSIGQALQVGDDVGLVPVSKQIDDSAMLDICDNAAVLVQQVQFIDPNTACGDGVSFYGLIGFPKDAPDSSLINPYLVGSVSEGMSECLLYHVCYQAFGHSMAFIHVGKRLKERSRALSTVVAAADNKNTSSFPSNRGIHELLWPGTVCIEQGTGAMWATRNDRLLLGGDVIIVRVFLNRQNAPMRPTKNIQRPLSKLEVLPKSFFEMFLITVAERRSFPTNFLQNQFYTICRFLEVVSCCVFLHDMPNSQKTRAVSLGCSFLLA